MSPLKIALVAHTNAPWTPHYARFFRKRGHSVWLGSFAEHPVEGVEVVWLGTRAYRSGERRVRNVALMRWDSDPQRPVFIAWQPDDAAIRADWPALEEP